MPIIVHKASRAKMVKRGMQGFTKATKVLTHHRVGAEAGPGAKWILSKPIRKVDR